jgi:uncharacterized membrane protein
MQRKRFNIWLVLSIVGGMSYPAFVYFSLGHVSSFLLIALGLGLIASRLWGARRDGQPQVWVAALLFAAIVLVALSLIAPDFAVKAYPVVINFSVACLFGASLIWPPTIVERIARVTEPMLPPEGQRYTRKVTQIWTVFLFANTVISALTVLYGSQEQWALWNGLISYLLMGTLFVGEYALRRVVRRRA